MDTLKELCVARGIVIGNSWRKREYVDSLARLHQQDVEEGKDTTNYFNIDDVLKKY